MHRFLHLPAINENDFKGSETQNLHAELRRQSMATTHFTSNYQEFKDQHDLLSSNNKVTQRFDTNKT